ncbi:MAG: hypothetical protein A2Y76_03360 [Planctomycetes bacterium RBG_13_60_9]|nr:MAG: hypothetical protein A2Y76_03360 [Planctomycetes bacterium RBG_13_60_9]
MPAYAVLAALAMMALGAGPVAPLGAGAAGAYDDDSQSYGQGQSPGRYGQDPYGQQRQQQQYDEQSQQQQQRTQRGRSTSSALQGRNQQLERQVANQLRQEGFGEEGQILILATGSRVILLGNVPDQNRKQQAEEVTQQVSGVQQVDNRLHVQRQAGRLDDDQLEQSVQRQIERLASDQAQNIQVRVQNGRVTLQGRVDSWQNMADVIDAAFAAGAQQVASQLTTSGQPSAGMEREYGYRQRTPSRPGMTEREYEPGYDRSAGRAPSRMYGEDRTDEYGRPAARTSRSAQRWQQTSRDRQAQQRLTSELQDRVEGGDSITVLVANSQAFLYGRVRNEQTKDEAARLAENTPGIQRVRNRLMVTREGWQRQDDASLESAIQDELSSSPFVTDADRIQVRVRNGTATLSGRVDSFAEIASAIESAYEGGARNVRNQLQMSGQATASEPGAGTDSGYYQPYGYTPGQENQGQDPNQQEKQQRDRDRRSQDQSQRGQQQMSSPDMRLARQVAQQLQQELSAEQNVQVIEPQSIYVMVKQGMVMLHGYVQDNNRKRQAEQVARSIRGVRNVQNDLRILGGQATAGPDRGPAGQQQMSASDRRLAQQIEQRFQDQLTDADIRVTVRQGTVTLQGSVQDDNQKRQAEQIARSLRGVQNVRNNITVGGQGKYPPLGYTPGEEDSRQRGMSGQQGPQGSAQASDMALAQQVARQLQQQLSGIRTVQAMRPDTIYIMARQGNVMLHGYVQDTQILQEVRQVAQSIRGVQNVQVDLSPSPEAGLFPPLGYTPGQEDQRQRGGRSGQMAQEMDTGISGDTHCIQMLKQNLRDQNLQSMAQNIYVTCHNGKMALYGYVKSEDEKDQLGRITKQIQGVTDVDNNLTVRKEGWKQKSDAELTEDVESQLWWSPFVDADKIDVSVQNGVVTLSGTVDDWDAMRAAVKNAFDAGAKRVRSRIQYGDQESRQQSASQGTASDQSRIY